MTPQFAVFIAPAQPRAALWRVFATLITIVTLLFVGFAGLAFLLERLRLLPPAAQMAQLDTREGALLALGSFVFWWGAIGAAVRIFHRRGLASLFGPRGRGRRRFALGFAAASGFGLIGLAIGAGAFSAPERGALSLEDWASAAALALPLLLIQTGAEEILFRGYLLQQLAARFRSPLIWAAAPSLLFGLLHISPEMTPAEAAAVIGTTALGGFILAIVTAKTGDLFAAWGLHLGVNVAAILFVSPADHFSGLALFHWPEEASAAALASLDIVLLAALGGAALAFSRVRQSG